MEFVAITTETMTHVYRSFYRRGVHKSELISSFDYVLSSEEKETVLEHVKKHYGKGVKKPYPCLNNIRFEGKGSC
jgi:predicted DNA-binding transcriptional regulator